MTVDLELADQDTPWPFECEEYAVCCVVDGAQWCTTEAIGSSLLMLHRFGGTYGPVRFALHVGWSRPRTPLRLILLTAGGIPFHVLDLVS